MNFFQVLVPQDIDLMGKMVEVEIVETGKHFMKSKVAGSLKVAGLTKPLEKGEISGSLRAVPQPSEVGTVKDV